jgi:hypothetical protein
MTPWVPAAPLEDAAFADLRRRAMFDFCKWDPQVGDACTIARAPLVLTRAAWQEVVTIAEALARETAAAERELAGRPELHRVLGLPRLVRRALRRAADAGLPTDGARLIRFDFHFTSGGWRISEANTDVPGGLNEASGLPIAIAPHYGWASPVGDPTEAYARAIRARAGDGRAVALAHATAYSDDQQMMRYVAARLEAAGLRAHLASPAHLRWTSGGAALDAAWWRGPLDFVVRFFPADWLAGLPSATGWPAFFSGARTPISNPGTAVLTQTKRFPLAWDALRTPLPTWRACLPETRDPRDAPWRGSDEWIVKPALGRVGEGVGIRGAVDPREMRRIDRQVRMWPRDWIAQRRFAVVPIEIGTARAYPCLGVYTLDERVVGAYGRLAPVPLVDARAADAAVLVAQASGA